MIPTEEQLMIQTLLFLAAVVSALMWFAAWLAIIRTGSNTKRIVALLEKMDRQQNADGEGPSRMLANR